MSVGGSRLEYIDKFFNFDVDLMTRTLYVGTGSHTTEGETGIDSALAERIIKGIVVLDEYPPRGHRDLRIIVNNCGGDVEHGLAIYDAIENCESLVRIEVYGRAHSMASIILQAGDQRVLAPHSSLMIHEGQEAWEGTKEEVRRAIEHMADIDEAIYEIYLNRIHERNKKFTKAQLLSKLRVDTYLLPDEAIELGLADAILGEED